MSNVDVIMLLSQIRSKYCLANSRQEKAINIAIDIIKNETQKRLKETDIYYVS